MLGLPLSFAFPYVLLALLALPLIWWLLRLTPPKPVQEVFPPTRILAELAKQEETPAHTPWWLILLRLIMAALVILAMAGPVWNPQQPVATGNGPVLLVIDNSWASGPVWKDQMNTARRIIGEAQDRSITLLYGVGDAASNQIGISRNEALKSIQAAIPQPVNAEWTAAIKTIRSLPVTAKPKSVFWLNNGLKDGGDLASALQQLKADEYVIYQSGTDGLVVVTSANNNPDAMKVTLKRTGSASKLSGTIRAFDEKGRPLATSQYEFDEGGKSTTARFEFPVELRNDFARIELGQRQSAGAVTLLDDRFRRRRVGLVSGEKNDLAQPLLSPLYYISRALGPYSEIRYPDDANIAKAVAGLIKDKVSTLVLADIGTLGRETSEALAKWVGNGGMLVRFAGPRLATIDKDNLIPVPLRSGDRNLGGSLTWATPQPLASFNPQSPFAGLQIPDDVTVSRQVLAEPSADLPQATWAGLADGTPLVTAAKSGEGWVVLFHVTANASWSNLALSGTFVDMLRRLVGLSASTGGAGTGLAAGESNKTILQPYRIIDGTGQISPPPQNAKPLVIDAGKIPPVSFDNPPGLYGTSDGFVALNLITAETELVPLDAGALAGSPEIRPYTAESPQELKPWLLAATLLLLAVDCLIVLWMAGIFARRLVKPVATALLFGFALINAPGTPFAQEKNAIPPGIEAAMTTRLAYVITGVSKVDEISRQGLVGLTRFIATRTSLEPGEPVGVDISRDELSFFPLLYWPIDLAAEIPDAKTMAHIDAYMKKGGTVIFDTRDALAGGFGGTVVSDATHRLRQMLADLDIPPLERVPSDHVLTKAFYLLDVFPGRYSSDDFWVESSDPGNRENRPVRVGDGVSSIIVTSNDLAAAWAVDAQGRPLMPTVPPNPVQRTYAYRVGVNLIMYMLTGNYKSDQVHIPALLERLGQ
ncbi:MAG: DUF4159 domain-containing protein [Rhodobacteraceae bacterium]|nr:DUF4159 domain-containing protein [Paracoccaceae bacterium]